MRYILDTDAPPLIEVAPAPACAESVRRVMSEYLNTEQFSDVCFVVEGERVLRALRRWRQEGGSMPTASC